VAEEFDVLVTGENPPMGDKFKLSMWPAFDAPAGDGPEFKFSRGRITGDPFV
jgi:hypothetical protein